MTLIPDRFPGERLVNKIWQTVTDRGIGGLLSPWQIRRVGKAHADVRRYEIQTLAQAYHDQLDILTGRKTLDDRGRLIEHKSIEPGLPARVGASTAADHPMLPQQPAQLLQDLRREQDCRELERAINLRETITMAEAEASSVADENVSGQPVDPDWFSRWRVNAEEIRDDQMRRLWARILSGEAERPGRFSLHALDFMRRLSKDDAALIEKMAPFVSGRDLIHDMSALRGRHLDPILTNSGLGLDKLLELQDLGVMSGVGASDLYNQWSWPPGETCFLRFWNKALAFHSSQSSVLRLPTYGITKIGAELMSLGTFRANDEYITALGQLIVQRGFDVTLGDVEETEGGGYRVVDAITVERQ